MALDAIMWVKDGDGFDVEGSNQRAGFEESSSVNGFQHQLTTPFDPSSGQPTGEPRHGSFVVTKAVDKASPVLIQSWANGTKLQSVEIWCYEPAPDGTEQNHFTIRLEWVRVRSYRHEQLNNDYPENRSHPVREHFGFSYEAIEWTYSDGRVTARDELLGARGS